MEKTFAKDQKLDCVKKCQKPTKKKKKNQTTQLESGQKS